MPESTPGSGLSGNASRLALLAVPLVAALAFSPRLTLEQYELPKQSAMLALIAVLAIANSGMFSPRRWNAHPALLLFLLSAAVSTFFSMSPLISLAGDNENLEGVFTWLAYALLFLAGNSLSRDEGKRLAAAVVAAATASALYGLLQQAGSDPFQGELFRHIRGFAGNPDFLAGQMAMALPLALGFLLARRAISGAVCSALFACTLLLTASRAGALAGLAGVGLLLWWLRDSWRPWKKLLWWIGIPALLALFIISEALIAPELSLRSRFSAATTGEGLFATRGMVWSGSARVVRDHPLLGSGTDTLKTAFLRHAPPGYAAIEGLGSSARKAHDEPLHFWATLGVLGLGAYIWILVCAGARVRPALRDPLNASIAAMLAAYLIQNLFSFGTAATSPVFWIFAGFLSPRREYDPAPTRPWTGMTAVLTVFLAFWGTTRLTADGYAFRGNEETRASREPASVDWYSRAYALAPYETAYLVRWAGALETAGRNTEALARFERAWSFNRGNGILLGNIGRVGFALAPPNNPLAREQALVRMVLAADMAPTQPTLYGSIIMALQSMGRMPERDDWIRKLEAADPVWAARMLGGTPVRNR